MTAGPTLSILWIDDYSAGDPFFVQGVARAVASLAAEARRVLMVHGAAERAARLLESRLIPFEERDGIPASDDPRGAALVERAYREANKEIVGTLTEFGVPAVGFQGSDRRMVSLQSSRPAGGTVNWLEELVGGGVVVVVSALAAGPEGPSALPVGSAVEALATACRQFRPEVCLFRRDSRTIREMALPKRIEAVRDTIGTVDYRAARNLLSTGARVVLCGLRTVFDPDPSARIPIFAEYDVKKGEF